MSLLTAKFVKDSRILARIYFTFPKNVLKQSWDLFNTKFQPLWKARKSSYQVGSILALLSYLVAVILG